VENRAAELFRHNHCNDPMVDDLLLGLIETLQSLFEEPTADELPCDSRIHLLVHLLR
jgi:hypothetical protein